MRSLKTMRTLTLALAAAAAIPASLAFASPAMAQANTRTLTVFGDDQCPTSNNEEIIVCRRLPEQERFRIPMDLREGTLTPDSTAGAVRNQRIVDKDVAADGIGSCSTVGAGGATGCFMQNVRRNREQRQADGEAPAIDF
jgi:hypothetical protein